jgi:fatty acid desaturase
MTRTTTTRTFERRLFIALWALAIVLAVTGAVLAVVTSSWVPLVCIVFGLAVPMMPFRSRLVKERGSARAATTSARREQSTPRQ